MKKIAALALAIIMLLAFFPLVINASFTDGEKAVTSYEGKTIACIGDSITAAVGVTKDENDYVTLLANQLGMEYIRLGVSGTTLCTDGHRTCNIGKLTEKNLAGADVVTILMGINDFDQAKEGYYSLGDITSTDTSTLYGAMKMWCERIVELKNTESLADTEFYFITPMITSWNHSASSSKDWNQSKTTIHGHTLRDMCNAIIEVSALYSIKSVDLNLISGIYYNSAEDNNIALFGGDGVHPGPEGHAMMAKAIANSLLGKDKLNDHKHSYGSWITTTYPSCAKGVEKRVCTICSATESCEVNATEDHSYTPTVTPPTCTEQGYTTYTCECGDSNVVDYVEAMGHTYKNGICALCQSVSPLYNKNVSILGDSISTFAGISKCSSSFYNGSNRNVLSVYDTWWGKLIEDHGMSLCVNYSQGGKAMFDSAVYNKRVLELHTDDSSPDIIFVFLGHNDKLEQVKPFEDIRWSMIIQESADGTYTYAEPDSFTEAYAIAVHKMLEEYPSAEVVLLQCLMAETSETYNQINPIIQAIGDKFGLTVVDFYENGLCRENKTYFPNDVHPNKAGMNKITDILEQVLENTHLHSFNSVVTPPTCTEQGYTTYTCECGESYVSDYVKVVDHSYGVWIEYSAPTCNAEGKDVRTCEDCGYLQYRDTRISGDPNKILVSSPVDTSDYEGKILMAIGDSITAGTGVTAEERYHYLTAQTLGMTNINSGTSGAVLCPGGHLPNKFDTLMTADLLKKRNVDVVTILLGVNDWGHGVVNGMYQGKLKYDENSTYYNLGVFGTDDTTTIYGAAKMWCERILELKATDGCEDIQFIFLTPVITSYNRSITYDKDWSQTKLNVFGYTLRQYCQAIMEVCAYYEIPVLDLNMYSEMYYHSETDNNVDYFGGDGIHPAANGHAMMAEALVEFLLEGYSYEIRSNLGHNYNETIKEPTCTENGNTTFSCPYCYYSYVMDEMEAQGHNYKETLTPPTCTEQGYTTYTCECGENYVSDYTDAIGHSLGGWYVVNNATCTSDGFKQRDCKNCDHHENEIITATGHTYVSVETRPTCTELGYTTYVCLCGDSYVSDFVDALGHTYADWHADENYHWRSCLICEAAELDKAEHSDSDSNSICDVCSREEPKPEPDPDPDPDPKPEPEPEPEPEEPVQTPNQPTSAKQSFIAMFFELLIELIKDIFKALFGA